MRLRSIGPANRARLVRRWARLTPWQRRLAGVVYALRGVPVMRRLAWVAAAAAVAFLTREALRALGL